MMKKNLLLILLLGLLHVNFAQGVGSQRLLNRYMEVKRAMITANIADINKAGALLKASIYINEDFSPEERNVYSKNVEAMLSAATELTSGKNLENLRTAFSVISPLIWEMTKVSDAVTNNYYYLYCTMRKAYWINDSNAVVNPYFEISMQRCGSVKTSNI